MSMASEFNDVLNLRQTYERKIGKYQTLFTWIDHNQLVSIDVYRRNEISSHHALPGAVPFLSARLDGTISVFAWRPYRMSRHVWNDLIASIEKRAYEVDRVDNQVIYKRKTVNSTITGESFTEFLSSKYELMEVTK